jgi:uncharacterized membrane protein YccC
LPPAGASIAAGVVPVMVLAVTGSPWRYGVYRITDIAIGLCSAIIVSLLFWPSRAVTEFRDEVAGAVRDATALVASALRNLTRGSPNLAGDLETSARQHLESAQGLLIAARQEPLHAAAHALLPLYIPHAERIVDHAGMIDELACSDLPHRAIVALAPAFDRVATAIDTAGATLVQAVQSGAAGSPVNDADQALVSMQEALSGLRAIDVTALAQGEELLRLYSLIIALESYGQEVDRTVQNIERPDALIQPAPSPATSAAPPRQARLIDRLWRRVRA